MFLIPRTDRQTSWMSAMVVGQTTETWVNNICYREARQQSETAAKGAPSPGFRHVEHTGTGSEEFGLNGVVGSLFTLAATTTSRQIFVA
jgi:hypothetical protein